MHVGGEHEPPLSDGSGKPVKGTSAAPARGLVLVEEPHQAHQGAKKKGSRASGKEEKFSKPSFFLRCLQQLTHL